MKTLENIGIENATIDAPSGWDRVTSGRVKRGDMYASMKNPKKPEWTTVDDEDIDEPVEFYDCLIRQTQLTVDIFCHNQYCLVVHNPSNILRVFLRNAITDNHSYSDFYRERQSVNPFLQSDHEDFMLIEFWTDDLDKIQKYVDFLNERIPKC